MPRALARRLVSLALAASTLLGACATAPRFPLRDPVTHDDDQRPMASAPPAYVSPFVWDGANNLVFRPVARFFAVDPAGPAANVNALDEVPDSSWFENRIGVRDWTPDEVVSGPCGARTLDPKAPDGTWVIDAGKSDGANPGFRVNVPGLGKFLLKTDPELEPERETGATAIAARIYHAAGYWSPCDSVVYVRRSILKLKPGLTVTDNSGVKKPFDEKALDAVLRHASHRGELVRMVASRWLPGQTIGPYRYDGTRPDDPNDVIPHEDRRELRGARLLAAWTNHFDTREQNTMNVFLRAKDDAKTGPGYVRHYILDLGDAFGSIWAWDSVTRRLGFAYYFDFTYLAADFVTLGTQIRPWEEARRDGGIFAYFSSRNFDPEAWKGGYPNPAFLRMTEGDGAWMARIIARFTDADVEALVRVGDYTDPDSTRYLRDALLERRDAILRRYLTRLSPLANVSVTADSRLCARDLAKRTHAANLDLFRYQGRRYAGWPPKDGEKLVVDVRDADEICVPLPSRFAAEDDGSVASDDPSRYVVVDLGNGVAPGVLRVHLYDLGVTRGMRIVGIERPSNADAP
jgi:hypothetical protein